MGRGEGPAVRVDGQGGGACLGLVEGGRLVGAAFAREYAPVRQPKDDGVRLNGLFCFVCNGCECFEGMFWVGSEY